MWVNPEVAPPDIRRALPFGGRALLPKVAHQVDRRSPIRWIGGRPSERRSPIGWIGGRPSDWRSPIGWIGGRPSTRVTNTRADTGSRHFSPPRVGPCALSGVDLWLPPACSSARACGDWHTRATRVHFTHTCCRIFEFSKFCVSPRNRYNFVLS